MAFLRSLQAAEPLLQRSIYNTATRQIPSSISISTSRLFTKPSYPRQSETKPSPPTTSPKQTSPTPKPTPTTTPNRADAISNPTTPSHPTTPNISKTGLSDKPLEIDSATTDRIDWTRSFHGLSAEPFPKEAAQILLAETDPDEVEIKPDGILYLPEIKYRRILNKAFGPGGWGLVPRSESIVTPKTVTREYALVCNGRLVSVARGEQDYFSPDGIPTATEGCRSNALVRCCKDLGIASELWDPRWIRKYRTQHTKEVWVEHVVNKRKSKIWLRKDDPVSYPWKETK
ncbi:mitochondrial genome maintenance MGM101-domain-containing protein [Aspergillus californicus]